MKAVFEGRGACFDVPFTPESVWYLTRFICRPNHRILDHSVSFVKDAKGPYGSHSA
jgi:hypothetical protein